MSNLTQELALNNLKEKSKQKMFTDPKRFFLNLFKIFVEQENKKRSTTPFFYPRLNYFTISAHSKTLNKMDKSKIWFKQAFDRQ